MGGGGVTIGNPKAWGDFTGEISGVERVERVPSKRYIVVDFVICK